MAVVTNKIVSPQSGRKPSVDAISDPKVYTLADLKRGVVSTYANFNTFQKVDNIPVLKIHVKRSSLVFNSEPKLWKIPRVARTCSLDFFLYSRCVLFGR